MSSSVDPDEIMSRLIRIYAVCKSLLLSPVAVKELTVYKQMRTQCLNANFPCRSEEIGRLFLNGIFNVELFQKSRNADDVISECEKLCYSVTSK